MRSHSASRRRPFTYREYCLLPEDGRSYELIEGDFYASRSPSPRHQTVSRRLKFELMAQLEETGLAQVFNAPIDLMLDDESVVQPDLVVVSKAREAIITNRGIEGIPDLVVEILSPSSGQRDLQRKLRLYERFGIPEYWVADPDLCTITQWFLERARYQQREPLRANSTVGIHTISPLSHRGAPTAAVMNLPDCFTNFPS